jgi:hypothetical protein
MLQIYDRVLLQHSLSFWNPPVRRSRALSTGSPSQRVAVVTANGRSLPALICSIVRDVEPNRLSAKQVGRHGSPTTIRHMNQVHESGDNIGRAARTVGATMRTGRVG